MVTISVCSIMKNEEFYAPIMVKSALEFADEVFIVLDSETTDNTRAEIEKLNDKRIKIFEFEYGENFASARQLAQDKSIGDWIFFLDADECLHEDVTKKIKDIIQQIDKKNIDCCHVQYTHFINDFAHVDNSECIHYGLSRLYKREANAQYVRHTHSLPQANWKKITVLPQINIFHLGYLRGMEKILERFHRNYTNPADFHFPFHQVNWRNWHYTGQYPVKNFPIESVPKVIKDKFMMEVFDK